MFESGPNGTLRHWSMYWISWRELVTEVKVCLCI